jgi:hypothetical protein
MAKVYIEKTIKERYQKQVVHYTVKFDCYTREVCKKMFVDYRNYVISKKETNSKYDVITRIPNFPEDVSENIIKFILQDRGDSSVVWRDKGDLFSEVEKRIECKSFTSNGPTSFTPLSEWDTIYFLDAREWLTNHFVLYRCTLTRTSEAWKNIKVNKNQVFQDQVNQRRRPRITWKELYPQIESYCEVVFDGALDFIE